MKTLKLLPVLCLLFLSNTLGQVAKINSLPKVDISKIWHTGTVPSNSMTYDPLIGNIIQQTNLDSLVAYVRILSGEDSVKLNGEYVWIAHRIGELGNDLAAEYISQKLNSYNLDVQEQKYSGSGKNIFAVQPGYLYPEQQYMICAHYDAVDYFAADDNASGVAAVIEAARILSKHASKYTLVYAFWDEEETGYGGSQYYASQANAVNKDIRGVLNLDMLGWDGNKDGQVDIHSSNAGNSNTLANTVLINNYLYSFQLNPVIYNPGTHRSDHASFWDYGYGAILLMEAYYGDDLNPYYHTSDDRIEKFDLNYFHNITQLAISTISTIVEVTKDTLIADLTPINGYGSFATDMIVKGVHTSFLDGAESLKIWLSLDSNTIPVDSISVTSNTLLTAYFTIPLSIQPGLWDLNIESSIDGLLKKEECFNIFPAPAQLSVSTDTLKFIADSGTTFSRSVNIANNGASELTYNIMSTGANRALYFNGIDGQVVLGNNSSLDLTNEITISAWFKTETPQWGVFVSNHDQFSPDNGYELCIGSLYQNGGFIYSEFAYNNRRDGLSTYNSFGDGEWHFVSAVLAPDGTSRGRIFVDGVEQLGEFNSIGGRAIPSIGVTPGTPLKLGACSHNTGSEARGNYEGLLDEVRIWDRALSLGELQLSMHANLSGLEEGLVGYWNFNEVTNDSVFDLTASGNHGILNSGVTWAEEGAPVSTDWLNVVPDSGACEAGASAEVQLLFDTSGMQPGEYLAHVKLMTNDPFNPQVVIPVQLTITGITDIEDKETLPTQFHLAQNYPNPFNPTTTIDYALPKTGHIKLIIYDLLGRTVRVLENSTKQAGEYSSTWDALDDNGSQVSSGMYLCRMEAGDFVQTIKLALVR